MSTSAGATKITMLVDNLANEGLATEHGFSAWIETPGQKLLFDTAKDRRSPATRAGSAPPCARRIS
jgi:metal-dependent hydrolase (beta-lactamase superfamily II)